MNECELTEALLDETNLAENRLIKIRKLKKKLRKLKASNVDESVTEGSALDRANELISTIINGCLEHADAQYNGLCESMDNIHARIDVVVQSIKKLEARMNTMDASEIQVVTTLAHALKETEDRLSGLEKAYDYLRKDVLHG